MSSFSSPLIVSVLPDGRRWMLERPFTYHIGSRHSRHYISVPRGFVTDWASIPKPVFWLLPWWSKFSKPSVLHDWLYATKEIMSKPITRKKADDIFLQAMKIDWKNHSHSMLWAYLEYWAVRIAGGLAWGKK